MWTCGGRDYVIVIIPRTGSAIAPPCDIGHTSLQEWVFLRIELPALTRGLFLWLWTSRAR
jgi:hypothetical protein